MQTSPGRAAILVLATVLSQAVAQCTTNVTGHSMEPGVNGPVTTSTMWDADGAGPGGAVLVVAGSFTIAGNRTANNISTFDASSDAWTGLGAGIPNAVNAVAAAPGGALFATSYNQVVSWVGANQTWQPLGSGMNAIVRCMVVRANGDLVVGGAFTVAGGVTTNGFARWDGSNWNSMGFGATASVHCLIALPNGRLLAGGNFVIGGVTQNRVLEWDGVTWNPVGPAMNGLPTCLGLLPDGSYVAGGTFTDVGGVPILRIARWNGQGWNALGAGTDAAVNAITVEPSGEILVGGEFTTAGGIPARRIARWSAAWQTFGSGMDGSVNTITLMEGSAFAAGGTFTNADGIVPRGIARWSGAEWTVLGRFFGADGVVYALKKLPDDSVVAGGAFALVGGVVCSRIAKWDGAYWHALGAGMNGPVLALEVLTDGSIVAGGDFTSAGGVAASRIARFDGTVWQPLGLGTNAPVRCLAVMANGRLVVGGDFTTAGGVAASHVAIFDGSAWSPLGSGIAGAVHAVMVMPQGEIVVGGVFTSAGGVAAQSIARWDGTTWSPYGAGLGNTGNPPGIGTVNALLRLANGDLLAGGAFSQPPLRDLARWNGSTWQSMQWPGGGPIHTLAQGPDTIYVGGQFYYVDYQFGRHLIFLAEWHDPYWHSDYGGVNVAAVRALTTVSNTMLIRGGGIENQGNQPYLRRDITACPAVVSVQGQPCQGSAGLVQCSTVQAPWLGSTFRSRTTGLVANALAFSVFGLTPRNTPLATLHPLGGPGCGLYTADDSVQLLFPLAGEVASTLSIPSSSGIVGINLFHQVVQFELSPTFVPTAINSSNGLMLTIGIF